MKQSEGVVSAHKSSGAELRFLFLLLFFFFTIFSRVQLYFHETSGATRCY